MTDGYSEMKMPENRPATERSLQQNWKPVTPTEKLKCIMLTIIEIMFRKLTL